MASCTFCDLDGFRRDSVVFRENELALFGNLEEGGALSGSGVIVPKAHKETVFDLSADEITATFDLLRDVRPLLEARYNLTASTSGGTVSAREDKKFRTRTCTFFFASLMNRGRDTASGGGCDNRRTNGSTPLLRGRAGVISTCRTRLLGCARAPTATHAAGS